MLITDILEQHIEEAEILATRRMNSAGSPLQTLGTLTQLDRRIEAHLDGLLVDVKSAWELCERELKFADAGEVFVGMQVALTGGDPARIEKMIEIACVSPRTLRGVIFALNWLPFESASALVQTLFVSSVAEQRYVAVAARAAQRCNGEWLRQALNDASAFVQARACRAVGELGRVDLIPPLQALRQSKDEPVAFWSCWSVALLGDAPAAIALKKFTTSPAYAEDALSVAFRRLPLQAAQDWIGELADNEANSRVLLLGVGILGDPTYIPGLIAMMSDQEHARIAAESFCTITGVNLADEKLEAPAPMSETENDDSPDDPDEFLPWPDVTRVAAWWDRNGARFNPGTRYLLGKPITVEQLQWALRNANQKIRHGAALELSMLRTDTPVFNVYAPAQVQLKILGEMN